MCGSLFFRYRFHLLIVSASLLTALFLLIGRAWALSSKVWYLEMESASGGVYRVWLSSEHARIDNGNFGYSLFAWKEKNGWSILASRKDSREQCRTSLKGFCDEYARLLKAGSVLDLNKPSKTSALKFDQGALLGCTGNKCIFAGEQRAKDLFVSGEKPEKTDHYEVVYANLPVPPEIAGLTCVLVNMPRLGGCVLQAHEYFADGRRCWIVRNRKLEILSDTAKVSALFQPPAGFKDVGKLERRFLFKSVSGIMDDMAESLGRR
ncbi:MAG: hypothetical protein LCH63_15190 [Candidatus Melainabacteria bacterium]|nr:hypothetical protein [Candidatus Melainabacteria bacterium]